LVGKASRQDGVGDQREIDHMLTKLDFRSRAQIAAWAVRSGDAAEEAT